MIPRVELDFSDAVNGYLPSEPLPPMTELFAGGEELRVEARGAVAPGFSGRVEAPHPLTLTAPATLDHLDGDLPITWAPTQSTRVSLILVGSTTDGRWSSISCNADDAAGAITIPAQLIAALPPPPRDLQLQASRDQIVRITGARSGDGVVLHAGYEPKLDGHQD